MVELSIQMPKMSKVPKMPHRGVGPYGPEAKVKVFYRFYQKKKQDMLLYAFIDFWFCILQIPSVYNKDGAQRHQYFRQFRHFRHFRHLFL
jgi:hypothetical protein